MKIENCEPNVGYAGMATAKERDGAFTDIREASDLLHEANLAVAKLANMLVGPEDESDSAASLNPKRCGGELGDLSETASSMRERSRQIIENVRRIERHAD